jgi:Mrp family chromosome partitioning ATPase
MIIVDGPPVMGLADAPLIGAVVSGCLLVVEAGRTTRAQVRQSLRRMAMAGAHMLGTVLTKYKPAHDDQGEGFGYGYGNPYAYGSESGDTGPQSQGVSRVMARARRLISK